MDENEEDTGPSARTESRSYGSETFAYLKENIEKETMLKERELELRKTIKTARKTSANCPRSAKSTLTNIMAQNNHFLAIISNVTGKLIDFREIIFIFYFFIFC